MSSKELRSLEEKNRNVSRFSPSYYEPFSLEDDPSSQGQAEVYAGECQRAFREFGGSHGASDFWKKKIVEKCNDKINLHRLKEIAGSTNGQMPFPRSIDHQRLSSG